MKITKATVEIMKNFASINQNILIKAGNTLSTRTVAKNLFATATVDTVFPQDFGIYNLGTFLSVLSLFSDPEIELSEHSMTISQGKNCVRYAFAAPEVLDYPDKSINMPATDAEFELSEENLKSMLKAGAVLSSTDMRITGDGSTITCSTIDPKNPSANTFSVEVGTSDRVFNVFVKLENLKLPTGTYKVTMSKKVVCFENKAISYSMFVANTKDSSWD